MWNLRTRSVHIVYMCSGSSPLDALADLLLALQGRVLAAPQRVVLDDDARSLVLCCRGVCGAGHHRLGQ